MIQAFVETSDSPFGCLALKKLFELADVDQSGSVDREELKAALLKLGFSHLSEKQVRPPIQPTPVAPPSAPCRLSSNAGRSTRPATDRWHSGPR